MVAPERAATHSLLINIFQSWVSSRARLSTCAAKPSARFTLLPPFFNVRCATGVHPCPSMRRALSENLPELPRPLVPLVQRRDRIHQPQAQARQGRGQLGIRSEEHTSE